MTMETVNRKLANLNLTAQSVEVDAEAITLVKVTDRVSIAFKGKALHIEQLHGSLKNPHYEIHKTLGVESVWEAQLFKVLEKAEREQTILDTLLETCGAKPTCWTVLSDAVGKAVKIRKGGWMEVRNALQSLCDTGELVECCTSMETVHLADQYTNPAAKA